MRRRDPSRSVIDTVMAVGLWAGLIATPALAQELLVTGQTTPVAADKNDGVPGAVAVLDDGTLQLGLPFQYIDTGLTVIDLTTGLEWEKKDSKDKTPNFANLHDADNSYVWSGDGAQETIWDWLDAINGEQFAGFSDWRIPNIRELQSLVNYARKDPASGPILDPTFTQHEYWSSTTRAGTATRAWGLQFGTGKSVVTDKILARSVRAVRGGTNLLATGQTTPRTADKNDGIAGPVAVEDDGSLELGVPLQYIDTGMTVIDLNTGLEWKKESQDNVPDPGNLHDVDNVYLWSGDGTQETVWDWLDAINTEQFAGYNDWRIPNIRELESIVHYGVQTPSIDPIFGATVSHFNLSSTANAGALQRSWGVNFENGKTDVINWTIPKWVRAVRNANQNGNQPPVAEANGPYSGTPSIAINFSSAGSTDPDGSIVDYSWNFGDGSPPSTAPNPSRTYTSTGSFTVTLIVTDNQGATGIDTAAVKVTR